MRRILKIFIALAIGTATLAAEDGEVLLRLSSEPGAPIVAHVPSTDPAVKAGAPVLDAERAALGWQWTEYTTTLEGYVPEKSLSKNFEIEPDTFVRAQPNGAAPVLTVVEAKDRFDVLKVSKDWATVRFSKAVPVYFQQAETQKTASITEPVRPSTADTPKPETIRFDPNRAVSTTSPEALPPENVIWSAGSTSVSPLEHRELAPTQIESIDAADIMVGPVETSTREAPRTPETKPGTPMRLLSGKLVRSITSFGPRYPIRLNSSSGQRIAYVDMSRIFISDLRPYLGQKVYIGGEVRPLVPGSKDLVILARTIRIDK